MKLGVALLSAGLCAIVLTQAAGAASEGTPEERRACTPDVFRLCSTYIPDATSITACLRERKAALSEDCRKAVFPSVKPKQGT